MANLFELLSGLKDKVQDKVQDSVLYNRLVGNNTGSGVEIDPVIVDNNGNMDYAGILEAKQKTTPTTLKEKLFGRTMSLDNTKVNQNEDGTYSADLATYSNRRPGLLNDISSGYKENRFNPIAISNLTDNTTTQDGRQKGFAYRLGEGLGSLARLAESPIGRGLLMSGAVLATNGSPLQALTYGTVTTAGNQGNRMKDQLYREQLKEQDINTDNIRGYITDSNYNNIVNSVNKRDSLAIKKAQTEITNRLNEARVKMQEIKNSTLPEKEKAELLEKQAKAVYAEEMQLAKIEAYKNGNMLGWANYGLRSDENERKTKELEAKLEEQKRQAEKDRAELEILKQMAGIGNVQDSSNGNNTNAGTKTDKENNKEDWAF